ncbi:MAG: hypothetical protein Q8N22_03230 [bacterium]|nr:hypothetical protein [bacterium]
MAIIVEEPKPPKNWGAIISFIIILAVIFGGVYFIFFQKPILIELVTSSSAQQTEMLSKLTFNPSDIQNNEIFRSLRQYAAPATAGQLGRPNPFLPF